MNRREMEKKRIVSKILPTAPILYFSSPGTAVQILNAIRFFFISRRFIYKRSVTNIRDWSLAYSFIYSRSFNLRCRIISCHKSSFFYYLPPTLQLPTITAAFHNFFLLQPLHILSYLSSTHQQAT